MKEDHADELADLLVAFPGASDGKGQSVRSK